MVKIQIRYFSPNSDPTCKNGIRIYNLIFILGKIFKQYFSYFSLKVGANFFLMKKTALPTYMIELWILATNYNYVKDKD